MDLQLLVKGKPVGARDDDLNLTDMWRAADSPSGRAPSDWLALVTTKEFVSYIEVTLNAGKSGIETKKGGSGSGRGATWGHWQIGLAYAKYLSPAFHAACNDIVRSYMEGRAAGSGLLTSRQVNAFSAAGRLFLRTLGQRGSLDPIADLAKKQLGINIDTSKADVLRQYAMPLRRRQDPEPPEPSAAEQPEPEDPGEGDEGKGAA